MLRSTRIGLVRLGAVLWISAAPLIAQAGPKLEDPSAGTLELVTSELADRAELDRIDGLAFDSFGNLFVALEIPGTRGGVVHIDKFSGAVTKLVSGISRADQIALHPSGNFFVTSEVRPGFFFARLYRLVVQYDLALAPVSASASTLLTSRVIDNPEGLVVLEEDGPFGLAGDLIVAEDKSAGQILIVRPGNGSTRQLVTGLRRPEGMAFGDFGGLRDAALYAAETLDHNVLRVESNGAVSTFGDPSAVSLLSPDNLEFGPDGFLYVSEDRRAPSSRVLRIAADGTHSVFATGFGQAQGMAFDPDTGDLYISEQDFDQIWRVRFHPDPVTIEDLRLRGEVVEVACPFCLGYVEDGLESGTLELRSRDLGSGREGRGRFRAEIELEFASGGELEFECREFASLSQGLELVITGAACTLSEGHGTIHACARFVLRPASGNWEAFAEPTPCDSAIGRQTLRFSGGLERFDARYRD